MKIETLIENLERTIKGKQALEGSLTDPYIKAFITMNVEELERILADVRKVTVESASPDAAFHQLWTECVGTPAYDKEIWLKTQKQLEKAGVIPG